jgi:signal transduction histidine kinase
LELIEELSMLSKLTIEEPEPWNLDDVLSTVVDTFAPQAAAEGVELEYTGCQGMVLGGPLLEALFGNLVDNAFTHANADRIEISCRQENDGYVVVVVDNGDGVPTETLDTLLEQGVSKGDSAGTGLGLYLVSEIAESYEGAVSLGESDSGGLCVTVRLTAA